MKATFAMGCFWHPQKVFDSLTGVESTTVGFMGGNSKSKVTYEKVCSGSTNHAEVVQINFNPKKITYEDLLEVFWKEHDPTTKDRQGLNIGSQYRSIIFYHNDSQKTQALKSKKLQEKKLKKKITTEIIKAKRFHLAEKYHQHYLKKQKKFGLF
jgi:peptide-methionine (S)-S-oxide reductase